jgi:hypothetical protein
MPIEAAAPLPDIIDLRKRRREMRALWRVCGWGGGAAAALTAVAIISQTENGGERLQLAVAQISEPAPVLAAADAPPRVVERVVERAVNNEAATRRLSAEIHLLTADRDRLAVRVASLEHQLGDLTGSIKAQAASAPPAKPAPQSSAAVQVSPPAVALPRLGPLAMPAITEPPATAPVAEIPLPPTRVAAAPAIEPAPEPPAKTEYGIDLGGSLTLDLLRLRWMAVKANYGPLLAGLHATAAQDRRRGQVPYRLLAGPLPTMTAAAHLCARFAAMRAACHPTKFGGENLAQR